MVRTHFSALIISLLLLSASLAPFVTGATISGTPAASPPAIVIGFVGGYVSHDNPVHAEVQLASHLRQEFPLGTYIQSWENHRGEQAYETILRLLDADHDGSLSASEKKQARIILYGHSWGASQSVALARSLGKESIPVLLTIQVDSVEKRGQNDALIPPNVEQAVNFYQSHGFIHGRSLIKAADPSRTRIIGNFQIDYRFHTVPCPNYPWWDRYLARPHTEIECDPAVWDQVESLIRSSLLPASAESEAKNIQQKKGEEKP